MLRFLSLIVAFHCAVAQDYGCPNMLGREGLTFVDERCPLQLVINGKRECFKIINDGKRATKKNKLLLQCKINVDKTAHLARITDRKTFEAVRCYIIGSTTLTKDRNPNVLLGMTYDDRTSRNLYWGRNPMRSIGYEDAPLVMRVSERLDNSQISVAHPDDTFKRALCQFTDDK